MNFFTRLGNKLTRTKDKLIGDIDALLSRWKKADPALFDELEEILIASDMGMKVAERLIETIKREKITEPRAIKEAIKEGMLAILAEHQGTLNLPEAGDARPAVVVIVGGNGTGKTTTLGKMSGRLRREGEKGVIAAADTFR